MKKSTKSNSQLRLIAPVLMLVLIMLALGMLFGLFDRGLALFERARLAGPLASWLLLGGLAAFLLLTLYVLWWLFGPRVSGSKRHRRYSEPEISEAIAEAGNRGVDTQAVQAELKELERRRESEALYICLFGDISSGKSSVIRALLPDGQSIVSDVLGGTTTSAEQYGWTTEDGARLLLVDVPGLNDDDVALPRIAREEAQRAHVVLYLCDGDLSRSQWSELEQLAAFDKPLVVGLNKIDRYSVEQQQQIRTRIEARLSALPLTYPPLTAVLVSGGTEQLIRVNAEGNEERVERQRKPQLAELLAALDQQLAADPKALEQLRDTAILARAATRLDIAESLFRREKAEAIVRSNTRGAVVGALAAISPGSDLIIQGALATKMVRELSVLYGLSVRDVEVDSLFKAANNRLGRSAALILAIAGNGMKAFPGIGTVAGGLTHAVAYGMLFDTFGHALAAVLDEKGRLDSDETLSRMESMMKGDLLPKAKQIAQLVWETRRDSH